MVASDAQRRWADDIRQKALAEASEWAERLRPTATPEQVERLNRGLDLLAARGPERYARWWIDHKRFRGDDLVRMLLREQQDIAVVKAIGEGTRSPTEFDSRQLIRVLELIDAGKVSVRRAQREALYAAMVAVMAAEEAKDQAIRELESALHSAYPDTLDEAWRAVVIDCLRDLRAAPSSEWLRK